jgi:hypothetical protein
MKNVKQGPADTEDRNSLNRQSEAKLPGVVSTQPKSTKAGGTGINIFQTIAAHF